MKNKDRLEIFNIIYDRLVGDIGIGDFFERLKLYGFTDCKETLKESLRVFLNSEYIEPYKLIENEVLELKYMRRIFVCDKLKYNNTYNKWHSWDDECGRVLFCAYQNLDKDKTYSIEEILANYEVVE